MGLIIIGAGVVLWWLTPDMARRREDVSRFVLEQRPVGQKWPRRIREYHLAAGYLGAVMCVGLGVVILLAAATGTI
jgi:hypothetical protein